LTERKLADHLGCDVKVINRIVNGRTGVTPEMALKLGAAFQMSLEFWLNTQKAVSDTTRGDGGISIEDLQPYD
jgi:addiction module HigA family antidote